MGNNSNLTTAHLVCSNNRINNPSVALAMPFDGKKVVNILSCYIFTAILSHVTWMYDTMC